jgi:CHAD domain-containing protein
MKDLSGTTQLWIAAHALLLERGTDLFRNLDRASRSFDAEAIHDLRVSSRRLREGLALFAPCYPPKHLAPLKRKLQTLTTTMGSIRNTDEALLFFAALAAEGALSGNEAVAELRATLEARRHTENAALRHSLRTFAAMDLHKQFAAKCRQQLIFASQSVDLLQPVAVYLRHSLAARETAVSAGIDQALVKTDVAAQHRLRIAVKKFRYRFEFLASLAPAGYTELYAAIKGYQEVLGKMHDLDMFALLTDEIMTDRPVADSVKQVIAQRRGLLLAEFVARNHAVPLATLGDRARSLL